MDAFLVCDLLAGGRGATYRRASPRGKSHLEPL
jgi:hypothetical protein